MKLIRQPPNSHCCGQACVATIAGVTLDEAISLVGKKGKTRTADLIAALTAKGFTPYAGLTRVHAKSVWCSQLLETATLIVKFKQGKFGHWVVRHKGKFYDPACGVFREVPRYLSEAKLVSFLVVNRDEGLACADGACRAK